MKKWFCGGNEYVRERKRETYEDTATEVNIDASDDTFSSESGSESAISDNGDDFVHEGQCGVAFFVVSVDYKQRADHKRVYQIYYVCIRRICVQL